jgi:molybdopterin-guanine dinucleotide biosynthesis protein MobB
MHENADELQPSLTDLIKKLSKADLILVEGFKQQKHAKIEVVRQTRSQSLIAESDPTILAVATDFELTTDKTCLDLNDTIGIADFIGIHLEL